MKVELELDRKMRIIGSTPRGHETIFDTAAEVGGEDTAAKPMEVMLQAMAACSFMDTISILRKKRKEVDNLKIFADATRAEEHPQVLTEVHLKYVLISPDAEEEDLHRAVELSQDKYCGASAMFKLAGCKVTWEVEVQRPA
ncbi:MAG: OsmC family protein [Candidatus Kapaibacterium sp.]